MSAKQSTSLATGTRPWTVVTTDQTSVDMLRTTVSETPANSQLKWMVNKGHFHKNHRFYSLL